MPYEEFDAQLIGRRVRARRVELGLTLSELARLAGVTRQTLSRMEQGYPTRLASITEVRKKLHLFTDQFLPKKHDGVNFSVHRGSDTRWCVSVPKRSYTRVEDDEDPIHISDEEERRRLGRLGFQRFFTAVLQSELPEGICNQAMMELHQQSWTDTHFGEEFVYCIRGDVVITVSGEACHLTEGDSMTFDAWKPHSYAPAKLLDRDDEPPRILVIVVARETDREERRAYLKQQPRTPAEVEAAAQKGAREDGV